jgi:hypothetical protein
MKVIEANMADEIILMNTLAKVVAAHGKPIE